MTYEATTAIEALDIHNEPTRRIPAVRLVPVTGHDIADLEQLERDYGVSADVLVSRWIRVKAYERQVESE